MKAQPLGVFVSLYGISLKKQYSLSEFPLVKVYSQDYPRGDAKKWRDARSKSKTPITSAELEKVVIGVVRGLYALHRVFGLVHRDIKTDNIFITDDGGAVLADFENCIKANCAEEIEKEKKQGVNLDYTGSIYYRPPDLDQVFGFEWDIFSLGLSLHYLLAGYLPYDPDEPAKTKTDLEDLMKQGIKEVKTKYIEGDVSVIIEIMKMCLKKKEERPNIQEIAQILMIDVSSIEKLSKSEEK